MMGVADPTHLWRVGAGGAQEILDDEVNAHLQLVSQWEAVNRAHLFAADAAEESPAPSP